MFAANLTALWSATEAISYEPEAQALFAAMTTPPSDAYKAAVSGLIQSGKAEGWWQTLDTFWMPKKAPDVQAAALNWIDPATHALTALGTIDWTSAGFSSAGSPNYMDTGFVLPSHAVNYQLNDARLAILADIASAGSGAPFGHTRASLVTTENLFAAEVNSDASNTYLSSPGSCANETLFAVSRRGSAEVEGYKDGVSAASFTTATTALPLTSMLLFARHQGNGGTVSGYWPGVIGHAAIGGGLSDALEAAYKADLDTFFAAAP